MIKMMISFLILFAFSINFTKSLDKKYCTCAGFSKTKSKARIYNGTENDNPLDFNYVVSLFEKREEDFDYFCSGSLINSLYILTAGHCCFHFDRNELRKGDNYYAAAGSDRNLENIFNHPCNYRQIDHFLPHPKFDFFIYDYDSGLVILRKPFIIDISLRILPVCLLRTELPVEKETLILSGYGSQDAAQEIIPPDYTPPTRPPQSGYRLAKNDSKSFANITKSYYGAKLRYTFLNEIDNAVCTKYKNSRNKNVICVNSNDASACLGDSGSPLMMKDNTKLYQIAILIAGEGNKINETHRWACYKNMTSFAERIAFKGTSKLITDNIRDNDVCWVDF